MPATSDDLLHASRMLRRIRALKAQRSDLKRSFDAVDADLRQRITNEEASLFNLVQLTGPITTPWGSVGPGQSVSTHVEDDAKLLEWAAASPFNTAIKRSVSVTSLLDAGCQFKGGMLVTPLGEIVPGVKQSYGIRLSVTGQKHAPDPTTEDWAETLEDAR